MKKIKILIVEDVNIISMELEMKLSLAGYEIVGVAIKGEEAVEIAKKKKPDIILMDIFLQGSINGITAAQKICAKRKIPIIYMTGNDHLREDQSLLDTNPIAVLSKPAFDWELYEAIEEATKMINDNS